MIYYDHAKLKFYIFANVHKFIRLKSYGDFSKIAFSLAARFNICIKNGILE